MSEVIGVRFSYIFFVVDLRLKLLIHPFPCKTENEGSNPSPVTTFSVLDGYANSLCVYKLVKESGSHSFGFRSQIKVMILRINKSDYERLIDAL